LKYLAIKIASALFESFFLDSLLKEIGMAPGEISNIRNILGDYENPKKDYHMNFDKDPTAGTKGSK